MLTTVLEMRGRHWWRWYLRDGIPYLFVRERVAPRVNWKRWGDSFDRRTVPISEQSSVVHILPE